MTMQRRSIPEGRLALASLLLCTACAVPVGFSGRAEARFSGDEHGRRVRRRAPPAPRPSAPQLFDYDPKVGPAGTLVTIRGAQLQQVARVQLNGQPLQLVRVEASMLVVRIPEGAGSGSLVVVGPDGQGFVLNPPFQLSVPAPTVAPAPTPQPPEASVSIAAFSPDRGRVGTTVVLEGAGFAVGDRVWLGQVECALQQVSATRIVLQVPVTGTSAAFRLERGGRERARSSRRFAILATDAVITGFSPPRGPVGTVVRLEGTAFQQTDRVLLGSLPLPIQARGPNWVEVTIVPGATSAVFLLVNPAGGMRAASAQAFGVKAPAGFAISGFSPAQGAPGTVVRITGSNLLPSDKVYLADTLQPVQARGPDWVDVVITPGASGPFVFVGPPNALRGRSPRAFVLLAPTPAFSVTFTPTTGAAGTEVVITVTPPQPRASVFFNNRPLAKEVLDGGARLRVSIPVGATSDTFELVVDGHRVHADRPFMVPRAAAP